MPLTSGTRLGPYEVLGSLGAGGMGEVYRARDTKLGRDVALKILPDTFANDPDRLARFEREAKTLASLNHPHIAQIYGFEQSGTTSALVMELVEGEDLSQRIARGPIPLAEALPLAKQIAEAIEAAHEQGIVHRDLKPANITIRDDGTVKVLDFGLAKALDPTLRIDADPMDSPTISVHATAAGVILGTAAYMSPEQAKGRPVDKRADLWAFGAVLYEMLVGRRAFRGDGASDTIARVLMEEPDWSALPAGTPGLIRTLLRRCLEKDRRRRLDSAAAARFAIEDALAAPAAGTMLERTDRARLAWLVAATSCIAAVLAVALAVATWYVRPSVPEPTVSRFEINLPPTDDPISFALSPDGRQLAFVATSDGRSRLWVRPFESIAAQPLAGTEGASYPFWAPDSQAIGFFADGKLKRFDLGGSAPQALADAPNGRGGTWNQDGVIVFTPSQTSGLLRITAKGGDPIAVTRTDRTATSHRFPEFLPDGRRFLFWAGLGPSETQGVYFGSLDGGAPKRLIAAETAAAFAPPHYLLVVQQGVLVARLVDLTRGEIGESIPVAEPVGSDQAARRSAFSVSAAGVLAHRARSTSHRQLVWVDRTGAQVGMLGPPDDSVLQNPTLDHAGRRVAVQRTVQGNFDIWVQEIGRSIAARFTFDPGIDGVPIWSPNDSRLVFSSTRSGLYDLYEKPASGGAERLLLASAENKVPLDWSSNGRFMLYQSYPKIGTDLWALPVTGDRKPFAVVQTAFTERNGQFSPDGRWVAYDSNESGRFETYVQPFPGPGGKWQVSSGGGVTPRWRSDGGEIFYLAPDGALMAVPVRTAAENPTLEPGVPARLFRVSIVGGGSPPESITHQYDVASDGQRFLVNVATAESSASPITMVLNWAAILKK